MARLRRICPPGIPQHVMQRGNNRSRCFVDEQDMALFATWLQRYSIEAGVDIHAWVFMTNHFHLLVTPACCDSLSTMMQALGRRYVRYFNYRHGRTGTLWEGRFKSNLVQSEDYLLQCYRYIELNPVRANIVNEPSAYAWSSHRCNGNGSESTLCTPHGEYLRLGNTDEERRRRYRALFRAETCSEISDQIGEAINRGLALGDDRFKGDVERQYGQRVRRAKMGRPQKSLI